MSKTKLYLGNSQSKVNHQWFVYWVTQRTEIYYALGLKMDGSDRVKLFLYFLTDFKDGKVIQFDYIYSGCFATRPTNFEGW